MSGPVDQAVAAAFRDSWGQIVATLIGATGDWDLAEESAQDAFTAAMGTWPRRGVPDRPGAWLMSVARNRATDVLRRRALGAAKVREVAVDSREENVEFAGSENIEDEEAVSGVYDDRLRLIFTCCHPALSLEGHPLSCAPGPSPGATHDGGTGRALPTVQRGLFRDQRR